MAGARPGQGLPHQLQVGPQGWVTSILLWHGVRLGPGLHPTRPKICLINVRLEELVRGMAGDRQGPVSPLGSCNEKQGPMSAWVTEGAQAAPVSLVTRMHPSTVGHSPVHQASHRALGTEGVSSGPCSQHAPHRGRPRSPRLSNTGLTQDRCRLP